MSAIVGGYDGQNSSFDTHNSTRKQYQNLKFVGVLVSITTRDKNAKKGGVRNGCKKRRGMAHFMT